MNKTKQTHENPKPPLADAIGSGNNDEIWQRAKREHGAAGKILDALRPVTQNERRRILAYFWDKYVVHPDSPNVRPQWCRDKRVRYETETESRHPLQAACSAPYYSKPRFPRRRTTIRA